MGAAHQNASALSYRHVWHSVCWERFPGARIEAVHRANLTSACDPPPKLEEIEKRLTEIRPPFGSTETFGIEEFIEPRETRLLFWKFTHLVMPLREIESSYQWLRPQPNGDRGNRKPTTTATIGAR